MELRNFLDKADAPVLIGQEGGRVMRLDRQSAATARRGLRRAVRPRPRVGSEATRLGSRLASRWNWWPGRLTVNQALDPRHADAQAPDLASGRQERKHANPVGEHRLTTHGSKGGNGGRCRDRTCDIFGVNEALYR